MNDFAFDPKATRTVSLDGLEVAVTDAAGMVWTHSNPAELYRWISRRNDLLKSIAVAFTNNPSTTARPMAG